MILKNQVASNLSDEKHHQSLLKNYHQEASKKTNSVTSPSANINDTEIEQEVPPFKPMIINSNAQALQGLECKTTTKKSPSGTNALKEAMASVNIQAKMPSSTTNKSLKQDSIFNNKNASRSYGALGVGHGPIKINQKIKIAMGSNQKSSAKKSQKDSSSKKMKISSTMVHTIQSKNLSNSYYQDRVQEQRNKTARNTSVSSVNQKMSNPNKHYSFVSGKPKASLVTSFYEREPVPKEQ